MNMATGEEMGDLEFEARRELPAFKAFPLMTSWTDGKPELPEGFHVAVIGSGFSGLAMAVQLERLGIPYVAARAPPRARRHVEHQPLPRHPRRHDLDHLRVQLREGVPLVRVLRAGRRGARLPRHGLEEVRRPRRTRASSATSSKATFDEDARRLGARGRHARRHRDRSRPTSIVNAVGTFANPKFPNFEGQERFEGQIMHPSRWPDDFDLTGKRVARHRQRLHRRAAARADRRRRRAGLRLPAHAAVDQPARQVRPAGRARGALAARQLPRLLELVALHGHRRAVRHARLHRSPTRSGSRAGRQVQPDERPAARRPHRLHQGPDRRPTRTSSTSWCPTTRRSRAARSSTTAGTRRSPATTSSSSPTPIARLTPKGIETDDGTRARRRRHRHRDRLRGDQVPVAGRVHRRRRRRTSTTTGRRTAPAPTSSMMVPRLPEHVHALRAELAAALGRHRPARSGT